MPSKSQLFIFYLLSFTWALPWTLVGLFVLLFIAVFMRDKVEIRTIAGRVAVHFKDGKFGGASLGLVYLVGRYNSLHTNRHELGHTLQHIYWGPLFIFIIAIPSSLRCAMWKPYRDWHFKKYKEYPIYDQIWFEGQATRLGYKYFKESVDKALGGN